MRHPSVVVTSAQPLATGHWLRLTFADGAVHDVDLTEVFAAGGVFAPIATDRTLFEAVSVDEFGTVVWPGDVDLDPYVLRGEDRPASGIDIPRQVVQAA